MLGYEAAEKLAVVSGYQNGKKKKKHEQSPSDFIIDYSVYKQVIVDNESNGFIPGNFL